MTTHLAMLDLATFHLATLHLVTLHLETLHLETLHLATVHLSLDRATAQLSNHVTLQAKPLLKPIQPRGSVSYLPVVRKYVVH